MHEPLVEKLCCPVDLKPLLPSVFHKDADNHIITGELRCTRCHRVYQIERGVPHLLPEETAKVGNHGLSQLQDATVERFGFEWRYFRDWGWLESYPDAQHAEEKFYGGLLENSHSAFWSKSLFQPKDLGPGLLMLDAGCGNGRFTYQAAATGAEVVGIDLGWGVYSAFEHTRSLPNVHIVRGDIFRLPFANDAFDRAFSIGVLMHTGDAAAAFDSIVRTVRPGGLVNAHVYGKGMFTYEMLDALVRAVTTRLSISMQIGFARLTAAIARWLRGGGEWRTRFYWYLYNHINLLPTEHHMYDWWAAPIATHHTQDEILDWFKKNGLEVLRTNPPHDDPTAEQARRRIHASITVLGRRRTANTQNGNTASGEEIA